MITSIEVAKWCASQRDLAISKSKSSGAITQMQWEIRAHAFNDVIKKISHNINAKKASSAKISALA